MTKAELELILKKLRKLPEETEWFEFKEAKNNYHFNDIGKYFSALSNEANLKNCEYGWLIFGVDNNGNIVGSNYRTNRTDLDSLKHEIAQQTTSNLTFIEIHELNLSEGRVILFQIPPAPQGIPISWQGHYYGRDGESLVALNIHEIEQIRNQGRNEDWSAQICQGASIDDLDPNAISKARDEYTRKNSIDPDEVISWNDITFLNKAKITIQGEITRAAIVILGKEESVHFLSPSVSEITWTLLDESGINKDYEHFNPPFILGVEKIFSKIRNIKFRQLPDGTLFPIEINQYDSWVIREALHNCIAHQDYELRGRISVIEKPDSLMFTNLGSFLPGSVENVIEHDSPPERYRNHFLAQAMLNLNMIDTIGSGIKKMYTTQRERFFPLPDYDLSHPDKVMVTIAGKIIDEKYTQLLMKQTDLELSSVILLDKVQKGIRISKEGHKLLKSLKFVEGRYPNIYVSAQIASATGEKAEYIKNRGFNTQYYQDLIIAFIKKHKYASRKDIDDLLFEKLENVLNDRQKKKKISNLISRLRRTGKIENNGSSKRPRWVLHSK